MPVRPWQPGAPGQTEQKGLGVVVGIVGGGDDRRARFRRGFLQKGVPQFPGGLFNALPPAGGLGGDVGLPQMEGDPCLGAPAPDKGGVPLGFRPPQPVVEVGGVEGDALPAGEPVEQAHGIRPAGDGAEHRSAGGQHGVFCCELDGFFQHGSSLQKESGGGRNKIRPARQYSVCLRSMEAKVVYSGSHCSSTVPVSPWRFLAMMHSARLWSSVSSS